jgi:hypothetical protein
MNVSKERAWAKQCPSCCPEAAHTGSPALFLPTNFSATFLGFEDFLEECRDTGFFKLPLKKLLQDLLPWSCRVFCCCDML